MGNAWTMEWGHSSDDPAPLEWGHSSDDPAPLLPHKDWEPQPVAPGAVRAVIVAIDGFYGVPVDPLLVAWDDQRATVRLANGDLRWYSDGVQQAFPRQGEIVVEAVAFGEGVNPRENRYFAALVVRSLEDLVETVNAETITSIDEDGTIHIYGEQDNSSGAVVREPDSGIILRASGLEGTSPWKVEVLATRLLEETHGLLEPMNVTPPRL